MRPCEACGVDNVDRAAFCAKCGSRLVDVAKVLAATRVDLGDRHEFQPGGFDVLRRVSDRLLQRDAVAFKGATFERRSPGGIVLLAVLTLGIYFFVWWYKVNDELRSLGLRVDPVVSVMAVTIGIFLVVPPFVSVYKTAERIHEAELRSGAQEKMTPWAATAITIGAVVIPPLGLLVMPYLQTSLNSLWDGFARPGTEFDRPDVGTA